MSVWGKDHLKEKRETLRKWKEKNPQRYWINKTLAHHREQGYKIFITADELEEYISDKKYCELCGKELSWFNTKTSLDSPSLDRLNGEKIITKDNIQLLCHECNTTKGTRTQEEFFEYCENILRRKNK